MKRRSRYHFHCITGEDLDRDILVHKSAYCLEQRMKGKQAVNSASGLLHFRRQQLDMTPCIGFENMCRGQKPTIAQLPEASATLRPHSKYTLHHTAEKPTIFEIVPKHLVAHQEGHAGEVGWRDGEVAQGLW